MVKNFVIKRYNFTACGIGWEEVGWILSGLELSGMGFDMMWWIYPYGKEIQKPYKIIICLHVKYLYFICVRLIWFTHDLLMKVATFALFSYNILIKIKYVVLNFIYVTYKKLNWKICFPYIVHICYLVITYIFLICHSIKIVSITYVFFV